MENLLKQQPSTAIKIVLFGPESTGKTTLAKQLAKHYKAAYVPEYMRTYLQNKWNANQQTCTPADILPIAKGQMQLENKAVQQHNLVFCDTNLLELYVYSQVYYKHSPTQLKTQALASEYHLYLLTYIDVPWEADDLRDKPNDREFMYNTFKNTLNQLNLPYIVLKGSINQRLQAAITQINTVL